MKKIILSICFAIVASLAPGQNNLIVRDARLSVTPNTNWVQTLTYTEEAGEKYYVDVTYYNGLGDPVQQIQVAATDEGNVVVPIVYDPMGRSDARSYLPFASKKELLNTGLKVADPLSAQKEFYSLRYDAAEAAAAFAETEYERTPAGRVRSRTRPGSVYRQKDKRVTYLYETNGAEEVWKIALLPGDEFSVGYYAPRELAKCTQTDEDGGVTVTFTDKRGRVVLTRRMADTEYADTYTVYDALDRPLCVFTPEYSRKIRALSALPVAAPLDRELCYLYRYDADGNLIAKRCPGKGEDRFVYDGKGRLVLRQDAVMASRKEWIHLCYDEFGNVVEQEIVATSLNHDYLREHIDDPAAVDNRLRNGFVAKNTTFKSTLSVIRYWGGHYRDLYVLPPAVLNTANDTFLIGDKLPGILLDPDDPADTGYARFRLPSYLAFLPQSGAVAAADVDTLAWGVKLYEKVFTLDGTQDYLERAYYYDRKGRPVQIVARRSDGRTSRLSMSYDFAGNILRRIESVVAMDDGRADKKTTMYAYDTRGRLLREITRLNFMTQTSVLYEYDALGRNVAKTYGRGSNAIRDTVVYNMQGWLTQQRNRYFSMRLRYYEPSPYAAPKYTGVISSWTWQHSGDAQSRTYGFAYDRMGRLTDGNLWTGSQRDASYGETGIRYDLNGNLLALSRANDGLVQYGFTYSGNRLTKVVRSEPTVVPCVVDGDEAVPHGSSLRHYLYDDNGNTVRDGLENLDIRYNVLNFVEEIRRPGSLPTKYTWLSDGTKLSVRSVDGSGYEYHGSLIYHIEKDTLRLEGTSFNGGRIILTQTAQGMQCVPYYFLTDHLGSVRVVVDSSSGKVVERNDYLPYGSRWTNASRPVSDNRYRFNGKEEQVTGDVGYLDYGARMYNPRICRWTTQDPLQQNLNAYAYCLNNPVAYIDPNGLWSKDKDGNYTTNDPEEINDMYEYLTNDGKNASIYDVFDHIEHYISEFCTSQTGGGGRGNVSIQGGINGKSINRLPEKAWHVFYSLSEALDYLWEASHKNGYAYKEHAAYLLKDGRVLLLPVDRNTATTSRTYIGQLIWTDHGVRLRTGYRGTIVGHVHTHPGSDELSISDYDCGFMNAFKNIPNFSFYIIADGGKIFQVWPDKSYKQIGTVE